MKYRFFSVICILIVCTSYLSGCKNVFKVETPALEEKVNEEIEYLDSEIISMLNSLNNITYTNYRVIPAQAKQSNVGSNPNAQMDQGGETASSSSEQKESLNGEAKKTEQGSSSTSGSGGRKSSGEGSGSNQEQTTGEQSSKEQQSSEIETFKLDYNTMLNKTNEIPDWEELKSNIEILFNTWITVSTDLESLGVSNDLLNEFSKNLDNIAIKIKNENKVETMKALVDCYQVFYEIVDEFATDKYVKNTIETKKELMKGYYYIETESWSELDSTVNEMEKIFIKVTSNDGAEEEKKENVKKCDAMIKELKRSISCKDREVLLIKYKNLVQELIIL